MWPREVLPFVGCFLVFTVVGGENCSPKACGRDRDNEKPICGSDGLSYPNRCFFERARCETRSLTLTKRGACKRQRECSQWANYLIQNPMYNNSFTPNCRPDGSYDSAQCHTAGFCWCVTPEGVPLPYTASRKKKPRCGRKKKSTRRRSPSRKHKNRICNRPDKSALNHNLINSFHSEYIRESGRNDTDNIVITWKFHLLDQNRDDRLDKLEYKDLRRLVKKAVKPKRCAKHFPRTCDINRDGLITLDEWDDCLSKDGMDDGRQNTSNDSLDETEDYDEHESLRPNSSPDIAPGHIGSLDESSSEGTEDPTDCISDRKTALAEGSTQLYVPECTPDGRYLKVQCYNSAGYCWCVNEDTGKNIPGTSVKNATPKCDHLKPTNKTMKGCPDDKKIIFLKELLQYLHDKLSEIVNSSNSFNSLNWIASNEEQAATWSFVVFDKNKNKMLERSEWKAFKDMVSAVKNLRKCGKKLPRYCDSNKDRQISMTEWLECLNVQQGIINTVTSPPSSRFGKKNPLDMLNDD